MAGARFLQYVNKFWKTIEVNVQTSFDQKQYRFKLRFDFVDLDSLDSIGVTLFTKSMRSWDEGLVYNSSS